MLWLYLRSVMANRATLLGYVLVALGFWAPLTKHAHELACAMGAGILFITDLGFDTYRAYRRAEQHYKQNGGFDERYEFKMLHESAYCSRVGFALAQKDLRRNRQNKARQE